MASITLSTNENIILLQRRHKFLLVIRLLKTLGVGLIPFFVGLIFAAINITALNEPVYNFVFWYFASLCWLLAWCWGLLIWLDWYLDIWIVTNQRIIDIQQRHLFSRQILSCTLDKIQNTTVTSAGPLATFFHYGNVNIKTADETSQILFWQVPFSTQTQNKILEAHQEYLKNVPAAKKSL
jgi:membrane protein YdbS with pleckstrin-like domain